MGNLDFQKIEKKWQDKWDKSKIFEADIVKNKEKFFFTTPYPYISGSLHIGHGRAAIESDIYCRFLRMRGYNVLYPLAFHISGTPILGISAAIKNKDENRIKLYEGYVSAYEIDKKKIKEIVKSFTEPQNIVDFFIPKMMEEYKQLGLSIDWRRRFTSGDIEHQQMVTWQFEKYKEKNFLIKEKYPVLYCPQDESAMGEDDIQDGDANPVEKQEFTLLKFKFKNKFLVAATLRPETIYGQTNLWMNPSIKYVEASVGNEIWILSPEGLAKLKYQRSDIKEIGKSKEKFLGEKAIAPGIEREVLILPSRFVDTDIGTGIVTSVPSDAPYDYVALRELQDNKNLEKEYGFNLDQIEEIESLEIIPIINTKKFGDKAGVEVVEKAGIFRQDDPLLEKLTQEVYKEGYHNGTLLDICGTYAGMRVIEAKEKMKQDLIRKHEADIMYETSRKAFSRSGGKVLVAVLDNQWFLNFNANEWKQKAYECLKHIEVEPELMRKQFEDTFAWLDKRPCARKRGLGTKFPFDKSWVIESLSDSTIYMTLYTIKHLIKKYKLTKENLNYDFFEYLYLGKGDLKSVSKKTGVKENILKELKENFEYWMPVDHRHTFSLHLSNHLSFMIFAFAGLMPEKYWPKKISFHGLVVSDGIKMSKSKGNVITLLDVKKNYGADTFRFYLTQSTTINGTFDWRQSEAENAKNNIEKLFEAISEAIEKRKKGNVKEIFVHKFNKIIKLATEKIEAMQLREYNNFVVYDMLNLAKTAKLSLPEKELRAFYNMIAGDWIKLIAPVCPHIAEELWEKFSKKGFASIEKWPVADEGKIDDKLEKKEKSIERLIEDINHISKLIKEKQSKEAKKAYVYILPNEKSVYEDSLNLIENKTNMKIKIFAVNDRDKYDPESKASKAKPEKPAIYIE
ncbi:MAG: leucine--tRNA ligase [Nanoarchaeota archaeon]